jgi:HK97 family phage major capsid protein
MNIMMELRQRRAALQESAEALVNQAEVEDRDFSEDEQRTYDAQLMELRGIDNRIERLEHVAENRQAVPQATQTRTQGPVQLRIQRGDNEERAIAHFFRSGDLKAVSGLTEPDERGRMGMVLHVPTQFEQRAVVDSTINITTAADGKDAVPIGFAGQIAERKNEVMLAEKLGCERIPGKGTTVNYPYDNADPEVFEATSEQADDGSTNNYKRDAVVLGNKAFTLAKKTKKLQLTEEILEDEDANLLAFISKRIGRSIANTHNALLLTEVAANGTVLKTFTSATAIAAGEPDNMVFNDTLGHYLDDTTMAAWVMRHTTFGAIAGITGDARLYAETPAGSFNRTLLGYPVFHSNNAAATAASAKDVYFGAWSYVGYREAPDLRIIVDPYTIDGIVQYKYSFRTVYGVLIAGAIGYGVHPSA